MFDNVYMPLLWSEYNDSYSDRSLASYQPHIKYHYNNRPVSNDYD